MPLASASKLTSQHRGRTERHATADEHSHSGSMLQTQTRCLSRNTKACTAIVKRMRQQLAQVLHEELGAIDQQFNLHARTTFRL